MEEIIKPNNTPIVLARKPFKGTVAKNVLEHSCGGINIDGCRVEGEYKGRKECDLKDGDYFRSELLKNRGEFEPHNEGRFPANVILECTCDTLLEGKEIKGNENYKWNNVDSNSEIFKGRGKYTPRTETPNIHTDLNCPCRLLDEQSGILKTGELKQEHNRSKNSLYGGSSLNESKTINNSISKASEGGASRFFKNIGEDVYNENKKINKINMKEKVKLMLGDNIESLKKIPDNSVHSVVTDPPYGLSFMNKKWDHDVPSVEFWKEVFRVLKPGGHVLSFGGTRTYHRLVVNIEDAGFEIRDQIMWLYGSGFPKSHNISLAIDKQSGKQKHRAKAFNTAGKYGAQKDKETGEHLPNPDDVITREKYEPKQDDSKTWEGWGTALKPANEPICLARKPFKGTVAKNVLEHSCGGINIDGCRVGYTSDADKASAKPGSLNATGENSMFGLKSGNEQNEQGRFPANVILECTCDTLLEGKEIKGNENYKWNNVDSNSEIFKGRGKYTPRTETPNIHTDQNCPCKMLDEQSGNLKSTGAVRKKDTETDPTSFDIKKKTGNNSNVYAGQEGGASRFFYCAKVSKKERNLGITEKNNFIIWENMDLKQELMELKELQKDISEDMIVELKNKEWNTTLFGKNITEKYQKDMIYIISTVSKMIIELITLNVSPNWNIKEYTLDVIRTMMENGLNLVENVENINQLIQNTTLEKETEFLLGVNLVVLKMLLKIKEKGKTTNIHATVKPIKLMRYLCRLITPPGGIVLDPFMGSGSTGVAALLEGFRFCGMDNEEEYMKIAEARIDAYKKYE